MDEESHDRYGRMAASLACERRGALAGKSGSAAVAHMGGMAALVGKAVALEPATGSTFDTPLVTVAH